MSHLAPRTSVLPAARLAFRAAMALAFCLALPPAPARAASLDCPALYELYRACHAQGREADSGRICMEASRMAMTSALAKTLRKSPQTAQALVDLVCGTGCEDGLSQLPLATRQEFTEAFCD